MKFFVVLADQGAADTLSKIAETVSKLCKDKVVIRVTANSLSLINADYLRTNGSFARISLTASELFSTYTMAGISEEFNEIYMELDKDYLYRSISPKEQLTRLRLTKIGNTPHIKVEQKTSGIIHEMPVDLIPTRHWKFYTEPKISGVKVAVFLPSIATVRNLITSMKNMGSKNLTITGNQKGNLYLVGEIDSAKIEAHLRDLSNSTVDPDPEDDEGSLAADSETLYEVRVDIRGVLSLLRALSSNFTAGSMLLRIVPEKMAVFSIDQDESSLLYVLGGVAK